MLDFDNTLKFEEPLSFHQAKEQSNGRRFVVYPLMLSIPLIKLFWCKSFFFFFFFLFSFCRELPCMGTHVLFVTPFWPSLPC